MRFCPSPPQGSPPEALPRSTGRAHLTLVYVMVLARPPHRHIPTWSRSRSWSGHPTVPPHLVQIMVLAWPPHYQSPAQAPLPAPRSPVGPTRTDPWPPGGHGRAAADPTSGIPSAPAAPAARAPPPCPEHALGPRCPGSPVSAPHRPPFSSVIVSWSRHTALCPHPRSRPSAQTPATHQGRTQRRARRCSRCPRREGQPAAGPRGARRSRCLREGLKLRPVQGGTRGLEHQSQGRQMCVCPFKSGPAAAQAQSPPCKCGRSERRRRSRGHNECF